MPKNVTSAFAEYCCELLSTQGPCVPKRMFGGYGISTDGLTLAIIADLGGGEKLWLKGDADTRARYEAAGCEIFTYDMGGSPKSMNYFTAPEDAMDSREAMLPWARLAMECAVKARATKPAKKAKAATKTPAAPTKSARAAPKKVAAKATSKAAPKAAAKKR